MNEKLDEMLTQYADAESVQKHVLIDIVHIHNALKVGLVTDATLLSIRDSLNEDTINYILRKDGFEKANDTHDKYENSSICYNFAKGYDFSESQFGMLRAIVLKYVKPFCDDMFSVILQYWNEYRQFA